MESATRKQILVVDDEPAFVQLLSSTLYADYEVFVARSGEEALAVCSQLTPDLILLDVKMPGLGGLETCRLLKAQPHTSEVPVIFITFQENPDDEIAALEVGGKDFISKPVNAHILKARIRTHLQIRSQQQALKQSEAHLRLALESARMGVWEIDLLTRKISWSPEVFRYIYKGDTEPTEEEFFESLVHPDDVEGLKEAIGQSITECSTFVTEFRIGRSDEGYRWVEDRGHVVLNAENNPVRMLGTVVEVTSRKQVESELMSSKQQLELALEASGLSLWDFDFTTGLFETSGRLLDMLGYQSKDMHWDYATWEALIHPVDLPAMRERLVKHLQGDVPSFESEHRVQHKDGHWVWIQARGKVIQRNPENKPLRMIGTHFDISNRKRMVVEGTDLLRKIESLLSTINDSSERTSIQGLRGQVVEEQIRLTRRQYEVLKLIVSGKTSAQIAQILNISRGTAIGHRKDLMRKLNVHNTAELTRYAILHQMLNT